MRVNETRDPPSLKQLARATVAALVVGAVVLTVVVIPAEYGVDPTGIGEALGLVILSDPAAATAADVRMDGLVAEPDVPRSDRITFDLDPGAFVEYKYRQEPGQSMLYAWQASGPVRSEMHSEADGAPTGTAEFFEIIESTEAAQGSYTAPFPGIHGWYWLNLSDDAPITVTLATTGFYTYAMEFRDGSRRRYEPDPIEIPPPVAEPE